MVKKWGLTIVKLTRVESKEYMDSMWDRRVWGNSVQL